MAGRTGGKPAGIVYDRGEDTDASDQEDRFDAEVAAGRAGSSLSRPPHGMQRPAAGASRGLSRRNSAMQALEMDLSAANEDPLYDQADDRVLSMLAREQQHWVGQRH